MRIQNYRKNIAVVWVNGNLGAPDVAYIVFGNVRTLGEITELEEYCCCGVGAGHSWHSGYDIESVWILPGGFWGYRSRGEFLLWCWYNYSFWSFRMPHRECLDFAGR